MKLSFFNFSIFTLPRQYTGYFSILVDELLQVFLKPIHIRAKGYYPVRVECFLHVLLFHSVLAHVSLAQINPFSFRHKYTTLIIMQRKKGHIFRCNLYFVLFPKLFQIRYQEPSHRTNHPPFS